MKPSYASGACDVPLIGETIGASLDRIAAAHPEGDAVVSVHQGLRLSYAELREATDELARGLTAIGVRSAGFSGGVAVFTIGGSAALTAPIVPYNGNVYAAFQAVLSAEGLVGKMLPAPYNAISPSAATSQVDCYSGAS